MTAVRAGAASDSAAGLGAIAEAGFVGVELGAIATGDEERLAADAVVLAGVRVPLRLGDRDGARDDLAALDRLLETIVAVAAGETAPVLLVDGTGDPVRAALAGNIEASREAWPTRARLTTMLETLQGAAERCASAGLAPIVLGAPGTLIETPRELDRIANELDPELVGLCLDVDGLVAGGGDPEAFLAEFGELVRHVRVGTDTAALAPLLGRGYRGWVIATGASDAATLAGARERLDDAGV